MCPPTQACINRACVNPCSRNNPCGTLAICSTLDHKPKCSCRSGFTGDAYQQCYPSKSSTSWLFLTSCSNYNFLQSKLENASLTLNVLTVSPVLRTSAKILVQHPSIPVESKLNAELFIIVLCANVHLNGVAIHTFNASSVSPDCTLKMKSIDLNFTLIFRWMSQKQWLSPRQSMYNRKLC